MNELIKIKVQQEAIPDKIKKGITNADRLFGEYLKVNKNTDQFDFGGGYYFSEPMESRGQQFIDAGKNTDKIMAETNAASKAQEVGDEELETMKNTMLNQTKFSNLNEVTNKTGAAEARDTSNILSGLQTIREGEEGIADDDDTLA